VRTPWLCPVSRLTGLTAVAAALALAGAALSGCGGVGVSGAASAIGNQLTVYSSLPLQGSSGPVSEQIVNGEKLALAEASGHVGPFKISYVSEDDSGAGSGQWSPDVTATNAKAAAQDTTTIAYLGDYNSAATAVSLPLINAAGILQVSPASPYVGLTSSLDAGQDEPERFYPSGQRNFGRLQPGDPVQAAAQVRLMSEMGVHKIYVLNDQDPFEIPLAQIVAGDAERAGITVAGQDSLDMIGATKFKSEVEKISKSGAQAVFFAGGPGAGTTALWQQLHSSEPQLLLLGSSALASDAFTSQIGSAGASTYLTTPLLATSMYPPSAARVLSSYRRQFGGEAGASVLYGYEAMSVVLDAIRGAALHGNDRQAVIDQFLAIRNRDSVLGRYSMGANGETTLSRYGVEKVVNGQPVFVGAIDVH
jgi:branched-chain amino acid transport system substrate-binding protein